MTGVLVQLIMSGCSIMEMVLIIIDGRAYGRLLFDTKRLERSEIRSDWVVLTPIN